MSKYLLLTMIVTAATLVGCSSSKDAELKGYVKGCSAMAHDLLDPQGANIDDAKLAAYCLEMAKKSLK